MLWSWEHALSVADRYDSSFQFSHRVDILALDRRAYFLHQRQLGKQFVDVSILEFENVGKEGFCRWSILLYPVPNRIFTF